MAFGKPFKFVRLINKNITCTEWDVAIKFADEKFKKLHVIYTKQHSLICNNCHSHVASFLNEINYQGKNNWTMVGVFYLCCV